MPMLEEENIAINQSNQSNQSNNNVINNTTTNNTSNGNMMLASLTCYYQGCKNEGDLVNCSGPGCNRLLHGVVMF